METPPGRLHARRHRGQIVTHHFVPEAFLAKELELCYAAVCYAVNYAAIGSGRRPFASGEPVLELLAATATAKGSTPTSWPTWDRSCTTGHRGGRRRQGMREQPDHGAKQERYGLSDDWRQWFK